MTDLVHPLIEVAHVSKSFSLPRGAAFHAVRDVSLRIDQGEVFGLIGKSGAGKSTLLRLINLLERPDRGTVTVAGRALTALNKRDLRTARQNIGMIFQQFNLLQNATVFDNPHQLQDVLVRVARDHGVTVLLVTHDVDEALYLSDRVVLLGDGVAEFAVPGVRPRGRGEVDGAAVKCAILDRMQKGGTGAVRRGGPAGSPAVLMESAKSGDRAAGPVTTAACVRCGPAA